ncbi:MAG: hypothetical protein FD180_5083, partial [Planctomycetota bacterium]
MDSFRLRNSDDAEFLHGCTSDHA